MPKSNILFKFLILIIITTQASNGFIIQAIKLQSEKTFNVKDKQNIFLYSDLHLPCQYSSAAEKQKTQNLKLKKILEQSKDLIVLFEGYPEDQQNKFTAQQISFAEKLATPAFIDVLPQTLKNNTIKFIPSDSRKTINTPFINLLKAVSILTSDDIDKFINGTAKIRKLTTKNKIELKSLERENMTIKQIFDSLNNFVKTTKPKLNKVQNIKLKKEIESKLRSIEKELKRISPPDKPFDNLNGVKTIVNLTTTGYKKNKDQIAKISNTILDLYEAAIPIFSINLYFKISKETFNVIENKTNKNVAVFAGQEHIENLQLMLEKTGFKETERIEDKKTVLFTKNLGTELEATDMLRIQKELDRKAKEIYLPNKAFDLLL